MKIVITGTPGTGKTTLARALSSVLNLPVVSVKDAVFSCGAVLGYDEERDSYIIDEEKLAEHLDNLEDCIIEGILAHLCRNADLYIILRTHPNELCRRLKSRGYPEKKILENALAEALDVIEMEVLNSIPENKIIQINTTNRTPEETLKIALDCITKGRRVYEEVDWSDWIVENANLLSNLPVPKFYLNSKDIEDNKE